jgi:hypothetical protein
MHYIHSWTEDSDAVLIFEHDNAGLKKLSSLSEQTTGSPNLPSFKVCTQLRIARFNFSSQNASVASYY